MQFKENLAKYGPGLAVFATLSSAVPCLAVGVENTAVTGAMLQLKEDIIVTAEAIIPYALAVFALIVVVKFGKRIFTTLAK